MSRPYLFSCLCKTSSGITSPSGSVIDNVSKATSNFSLDEIKFVHDKLNFTSLPAGTYFLSCLDFTISGKTAKGNSSSAFLHDVNSASNVDSYQNVYICLGGVSIPSHSIHHRITCKYIGDFLNTDECYLLVGNSSSATGEPVFLYDKYKCSFHERYLSDGRKEYTLYYDLKYTSSAPAVSCAFVARCKGKLPNFSVNPFEFGAVILYDKRDYLDNGYKIFNEDNGLPLSALPFRAYESIYNSFYRDTRNNPFLVDGKPSYNEYLETTEGGLDPHKFRLHRRNWELDMFTSCVQSPQQGVAPLVGISSLGEVSFAAEDGNTYTFSSQTAEDGDTITGINVTQNIPNSVARSVLNVVQQGISINDFRNVNAFQRWKETNIRRGLKFKDQIKARWGVDVHLNTLDMPEFIGGISTDVDINTINQTSETENAPLGSYAGQATAFGSSHHKVSQYCDEHGFIMGILSIVPVPVYSQVLPRYFTRFNPLDYFNPEFGQIGMQPVTNRDLCPINAVLTETPLTDVFGYNRPWPEYMSSFDTAHGEFRTTLKNFLLMREFGNVPKLGSDFTTINHTELNNVFATEDGHKALGCIYFNVTGIRPIPSVSVPSLE